MATAFKKLNKARQAVGKAEESSDESIDSQASQSGDEGQVKQENVSTSAKDVQESAEEVVEAKPKVFDEQEGLMAFKDPDLVLRIVRSSHTWLTSFDSALAPDAASLFRKRVGILDELMSG